jgi:hypothetical protein
VQLQIRAASVGILWCGMLKYPGKSSASLAVCNKISKGPATCLKSGASLTQYCSSLN